MDCLPSKIGDQIGSTTIRIELQNFVFDEPVKKTL